MHRGTKRCLTIALSALVLISSAVAQEKSRVISRSDLQDMFDSIAQKSGWDMSKPMVWGYFFTHHERAPLERVAELLVARGYSLIDIRLGDKDHESDPDVWWLHVERIEVHTVATLDALNKSFYELADGNGIDSYDGMDVGPVVLKQ
jgi:Regulator of ribonuclease activity B